MRTHRLTLRALWYAPPVTVHQLCEWLRFNICGKNALRSKFAERYGFAGIPKPPLAVPRTVRGGGIFEENAGGDMPQISECFLNLWRSNPLRPFGPFPPDRGNRPLEPKGSLRGRTVRRGRCPLGPLGSYEFAEEYRKNGISCGRTESSAPTGESEGSCRGRRLCRPIGQLRVRRRFP